MPRTTPSDAQELMLSGALIRKGEFPFRRVLLLALAWVPTAPKTGDESYCGWCSDSGDEPFRVRSYPEVGPRHPQCFIDEFILMGDALTALERPPEDY